MHGMAAGLALAAYTLKKDFKFSFLKLTKTSKAGKESFFGKNG